LFCVSSPPQAISCADLVVVLEKGHVKWVGSSADLSASSYSAFSPLNEFDTYLHIQRQDSSVDTNSEVQLNILEKITVGVSEEAQEIIEVEQRKEGRVELTVYE
jgi:ATP-binding cassette subfamily C (CFTR/MRP) protein 10